MLQLAQVVYIAYTPLVASLHQLMAIAIAMLATHTAATYCIGYTSNIGFVILVSNHS